MHLDLETPQVLAADSTRVRRWMQAATCLSSIGVALGWPGWLGLVAFV